MTVYLQHKGYQGTVEPQLEDDTLFGKIVFINDLVTYEAKDLVQLKKEFQISVDDYLVFCKERGKSPDKPFKGSFNVRLGAKLHRAAAIASADKSLNAFVCEAIREKIGRCQMGEC